jgi:hypothetical protein
MLLFSRVISRVIEHSLLPKGLLMKTKTHIKAGPVEIRELQITAVVQAPPPPPPPPTP